LLQVALKEKASYAVHLIGGMGVQPNKSHSHGAVFADFAQGHGRGVKEASLCLV
jgi:hypothetical protein